MAKHFKIIKVDRYGAFADDAYNEYADALDTDGPDDDLEEEITADLNVDAVLEALDGEEDLGRAPRDYEIGQRLEDIEAEEASEDIEVEYEPGDEDKDGPDDKPGDEVEEESGDEAEETDDEVTDVPGGETGEADEADETAMFAIENLEPDLEEIDEAEQPSVLYSRTIGDNVPVLGKPGDALKARIKEDPKIAEQIEKENYKERKVTKGSLAMLVVVIALIAVVGTSVAFALVNTRTNVSYPDMSSMVNDDGAMVAASLEPYAESHVSSEPIILSSSKYSKGLENLYLQSAGSSVILADEATSTELDGQWVMTLGNSDLGYMSKSEVANGTDVDSAEIWVYLNDDKISCKECYEVLKDLGLSDGKIRMQVDDDGLLSGSIIGEDKSASIRGISGGGIACVNVSVFAWESNSSYKTALAAFEMSMEDYDKSDYRDSFIQD